MQIHVLGSGVWAIAEGYIPEEEEGSDPRPAGRETACILNTSSRTAHVQVMIYYSDRDPVGPYELTVQGRRTYHMNFNELSDPAPIARGQPFASVFFSDTPIVVQHTRLDMRRADAALMSTLAYCVPR